MKTKTFLLLLAALVCLPATSVYAGDENSDGPALACAKCPDCTFIYNEAIRVLILSSGAVRVCDTAEGSCCNTADQDTTNLKCDYDWFDRFMDSVDNFVEQIGLAAEDFIKFCKGLFQDIIS